MSSRVNNDFFGRLSAQRQIVARTGDKDFVFPDPDVLNGLSEELSRSSDKGPADLGLFFSRRLADKDHLRIRVPFSRHDLSGPALFAERASGNFLGDFVEIPFPVHRLIIQCIGPMDREIFSYYTVT